MNATLCHADDLNVWLERTLGTNGTVDDHLATSLGSICPSYVN